MAKPIPLSVQITRLFVLVGTIVLLLVFAATLYWDTRGVKKQFRTIMVNEVRSSRALLKHYVKRQRSRIRSLIPASSAGTSVEAFKRRLSALDPDDHFLLLDGEGRALLTTDGYQFFLGLDFSHLPYLENREEVSNIHRSLFNQNHVVAFTFELPGDRLLVVEESLEEALVQIAHIDRALVGESLLFILARDGTVVYHPDPRFGRSRFNLGSALQDMSAPDSLGLQVYTLEGVKYLSYREALSAPAGWVIYSALPFSLLTRALVHNVLIHSLFLAITVLGVLVLLRLLIRQRLSSPIQRLSTYLENWGTRDEQAMPKEIVGNTQELELIASSVKQMITRVRETNEQLEKSSQLFRTVTEFALDWAYWLSPEGELLYISPASVRITGYTKQEFYSNPELLFGITHPGDREYAFAHTEKAVTGEAHGPLEYRIITKDGKVRWISHVCRGIYGADGQFQGVRGSNTDITEKKVAEAVLRESEERFRTLFEQAADGIFVHDLKGKFIDVNQQGCEMLGYSKEELLKLSVFEVEGQADRQTYLKLWADLTPGATLALEGTRLKKDGTPLPVEIRLAPVFWGENRYILAVARDISERQRTQAELAKEKELLDITLRSIGDGMICADPEGRVVIFNRMAEVLTGWTEKEAQGRRLEEVFYRYYEESGEACPDPTRRISETGEAPTLGPCVLVTREGEKRLIMDSSAPIYNLNEFKGTVIIFRDITEQRKLEQEALRADKLESLGILAGGIAHDFNNLLTAVLGNLSLAKMHVDPRSNIINHLNAAEKASLRTRDLTQQLLTFARGGAPIKETTSIGELIRDSAHFVLRGSNVRLDLTLAPDLWPAEVDPGQMNQVVNNLIINADQAMPQGGVVEVRAENTVIEGQENLPLAAGRYVKVVIKDQGVGIPAAHLRNIFDPYFTTKQQGSGLGLASSYSIIKRHGGHIKVESRVGEGATFTIYLPAGRQIAGAETLAEEEALEGHGRILVMDDDAMVRRLSGELLSHLGFEVDFAKDGAEALEFYRKAVETKAPYRLVIMDLTIPGGMGGKDAVRKVLELDPAAKVLVSSGFAQDPVMSEYERYGFSGKLTKPYNIKEMVRTISRLL